MVNIAGGALSIDLPGDSVWVNETDFSPISESKKFTLGGRMEITQKNVSKNRKIIIDCFSSMPETINKVNKSKIDQLSLLRDSAVECYLTVADGRVFKVFFDNASGHIEANPLVDYAVIDVDDLYSLILHFYTI